MGKSVNEVFRTKPYPDDLAGGHSSAHQGELQTQAYQATGIPSVTPGYIPRQPVSRSSPLFAGEQIELNSINYQVVDVISGEGQSSEAVIYKITNNEGQVFALKLYYEFPGDALEPSADTLQRIREISGQEILKLYDFGTGPNKFLNRHCFEISAFAAGGDLLSVSDFGKKYSPEFIEQVVSSIHRGISHLHEEKIYHCDLKPQNVFFLDEEQTTAVIGDYGSAKSFDKAFARELNYTTLTKGTDFYLAPEQAFGIVSGKNDYYSLGMIVLHLLYPQYANRQNLRRIFERRTKGLPIIDFDKNYARINSLIEGLTLQDYNRRWGGREVNRWLDGLEVPVNYGRRKLKRSLRIGDATFGSGRELSEYIEGGNPFFEALIEDREGYSLLLTWIDELEGEESRKIFDGMISHYKKFYGLSFVREAMLFYFNPSRSFKIGSKSWDFNDPEKLGLQVEGFFRQIDEIWKFTDLDTLRHYFFQFEFAIRRLRVKSGEKTAREIDRIFETVADIGNISYDSDFTDLKAGFYISFTYEMLVELLFAFVPSRVFKDHENVEYGSLFEMTEFMAGDPARRQDEILQLEQRGFLLRASKSELIEFLEYSNHWESIFLKEQAGTAFLARIVFNLCDGAFGLDFIEGFCDHAARHGADHLRIAVIRLLDPAKPLQIGNSRVELARRGDFNNKVREIFALIDTHWKRNDIEPVKKILFEFELTLLQMARTDTATQRILVIPLIEKMVSVLGAYKGQIETLTPYWFARLSPHMLMDLFYLFNQSRNYRLKGGDTIDNLRDIAFYYARNPDEYEDNFAVLEREAFCRNKGMRSLSGLDLKSFLIRIFRERADIETQIDDVVLNEPLSGQITIFYRFKLSLVRFFRENKIDLTPESTSREISMLTIRGNQFTPSDVLYQRFSGKVIRRHQPGAEKLSDDSEPNFKSVLHERKHASRFSGMVQLPRYLLFLLPVFTLAFLTIHLLTGQSLITETGKLLWPGLEIFTHRVLLTNASVLLLSAYTLNFLTGIAIVLPVTFLRRNRKRFYHFLEYHRQLIRRISLFVLLAPLIFIAVYFFLWNVISPIEIPVISLRITATHLTILGYLALLAWQVVLIIRSLYKSYREFSLLPFAVSILIYLIAGYIMFLPLASNP